MNVTREKKLAALLVSHSVRLQKGESCLIEAIDLPVTMTEALIEAVYEAGGNPVVNVWSERIERAMVEGATEDSLKVWADVDSYRMKTVDAYIGIRGIANVRELASIPSQVALSSKLYNTPVHRDIRVPHTKWVVARFPTEIMAMQAGKSTREFEDFFYKVTTEVDYEDMARRFTEAKPFLDAVDKVRIIAPGTDLSFSVKGLGWIPCAGEMNIPDGEIYTAPVRTSVNGTIAYNCDSTYRGHKFSDVRFTFKDGKIVEAHADDDVLLTKILDSDEGARYVGEFALGVNPQVTEPMDNTLFDEKIRGSLHFTPGNAYDDCFNGNRSAVHWDLVQRQDAAVGGGEIWMDGVLVRKDGVFVHEALKVLNL
ncbi:aminopeptidase [Parasphaerochaeta coccoides]|uniref:Peptidase M29 aminopeptidase II n=1 Tax=Parasphaerochaeta coccoides (strain ATCC BAA-1237 / DSM 17374 / SPN1) TaxID=760011 RepID=F4GHB2_PARC1|nr:aminopeptidase [Parasphaerochaeta coccoides]AEC02011.1 peptidase M29 aminopeptidase II [Parasphaerochaeta coccoides DSM 17374]